MNHASRDDFPDRIKRVLAERVNFCCSNPDCRAQTSGPQEDASKAVNVGVAAHITAAAPGGPRYDPGLTHEQRADITNGIWLCQTCAKLVDNDPVRFTPDILRGWKSKAEQEARNQVGKTVAKDDKGYEAPIPHADPNRVSVLVARMENDPNGEQKQLILNLLRDTKGIKGIHVLDLDRTVSGVGVGPEERERAGHAKARTYLESSGASMLIWGAVLRYGSQARPQLYMTTIHSPLGQPKQYSIETETDFRLPEVFWSDMATVLQMLVVSRSDEFDAMKGHYVADRLLPFIVQVRTLLAASADRPGWDADARGQTRMILANALKVMGDQSGNNELLLEAVAAYRAALEIYKSSRTTHDIDITKNNLRRAEDLLHERQRTGVKSSADRHSFQ